MQKCTNVGLPNWVDNGMFSKMEQCIQKFLDIAFGSDELKKLSGGKIPVTLKIAAYKTDKLP